MPGADTTRYQVDLTLEVIAPTDQPEAFVRHALVELDVVVRRWGGRIDHARIVRMSELDDVDPGAGR